MADKPPLRWDPQPTYTTYPGRNLAGYDLSGGDTGAGTVDEEELLWWGMVKDADLVAGRNPDVASGSAHLKRLTDGTGALVPRGTGEGPGTFGHPGRTFPDGVTTQYGPHAQTRPQCLVQAEQSDNEWSFFDATSNQCRAGRFREDSGWRLFVRSSYTPPPGLPRRSWYGIPTGLKDFSPAFWFDGTVILLRFTGDDSYATFRPPQSFGRGGAAQPLYAEPFRVALGQPLKLRGEEKLVQGFNLYPGISYKQGRGRFMHHSISNDVFSYGPTGIDANNPQAQFYFEREPSNGQYYLRAAVPDGDQWRPTYVALDEGRNQLLAKSPRWANDQERDRLYPQAVVVEPNAYITRLFQMYADPVTPEGRKTATEAKFDCCYTHRSATGQPDERAIVAACKTAGLGPDTGECDTHILDYCAADDNMLTDGRCAEYMHRPGVRTDSYLENLCAGIPADKKAAPIPTDPSVVTWSRVCACFRGPAFYDNYAKSLAGKVVGPDLNVGFISGHPEYFYAPCAAETQFQTERKKNGKLPGIEFQSCVQIISVDAEGNVGDVTINPSTSCTNDFKKNDLPPPPGGPTITSLSPTSGPVGTLVRVSGTKLTGATRVSMGSATAVTADVSSSSFTFVVPAGAVSGRLVVDLPGGTTVTSPQSFIVGTTTGPTITALTPPSGAVGTTVKVTGTKLLGATRVSLGGGTADPSGVTDTGLTFAVPVGATTGPVRITIPGGLVASSVEPFVVPGTPAPTPTPTPPKKKSLAWLWWTLGIVGALGLILLIVLLARRGRARP